MYEYLIFEGRGDQTIIDLGVVKYLQENNQLQQLKGVCGSSGGSITAFLTCCKDFMTPDRMVELFRKYVILSRMSTVKSLHVPSTSTPETFGLFDTKDLEKSMAALIQECGFPPDITFLDLYNKTNRIELTITGTNVNYGMTKYWNYNTNPKMYVREALMISSCFPGYYRPYKYHDDCYYVDGGVYNDMPLNYILRTHPRAAGILSVMILNNLDHTNIEYRSDQRIKFKKCKELHTGIDYLEQLVLSVWQNNFQQRYLTDSRYSDYLLPISIQDRPDLKLMYAFSIPEEHSEYMINLGYRSMAAKLNGTPFINSTSLAASTAVGTEYRIAEAAATGTEYRIAQAAVGTEYRISHSRVMASIQSFIHAHLRYSSTLAAVNNTLQKWEELLNKTTAAAPMTLDYILEHIDITNKIEVYVVLLIVLLLFRGPESKEYKYISSYVLRESNIDYRWIETGMLSLYNNFIHHNTTLKSNYVFSSFPKIDHLNPPAAHGGISILLLADFATGLDKSLFLLQEAKRVGGSEIVAVIHGGDTYFSGTPKEQRENFVRPIRKVFPAPTLVRNARGNHDMYSKDGTKTMLKCIEQSHTFFCIEVEVDGVPKLAVHGVDTAYMNIMENDNVLSSTMKATGVTPAELEWHRFNIHSAASRGYKNILLTHHQPITYNDDSISFDGKHGYHNPVLLNQFHDVLHHVDAWFWGHEHAFNLYEPYTFQDSSSRKICTISKPRLIGHGGCPALRSGQDATELYSPPRDGFFDMSQEENYPLPELLNGEDWKLRYNDINIIDIGFVIIRIVDDNIKLLYYNIHSPSPNVCEPAKLVFEEVL